MSGRERQRILREEGGTGGNVAETEKQEAAKASKQALDEEQAAEQQEAAGARTPAPGEQADAKVKRRARRARRARAAAESGDRDPAEGGTAHREQLEEEVAEERGAAAGERTDEDVADAQEAARAEDAEEEAGDDDVEARRARRAGRRRRAAETTTTAPRAAPEGPRDGAVAVRARARYVRCAPRKARLVVDHIRGKSVAEARAILQTTPRAASRDVLKLLESCVANAENNHDLAADDLRIGQAVVDEGPIIKRYRPRALGRATRINKRTSHMTITLTTR